MAVQNRRGTSRSTTSSMLKGTVTQTEARKKLIRLNQNSPKVPKARLNRQAAQALGITNKTVSQFFGMKNPVYDPRARPQKPRPQKPRPQKPTPGGGGGGKM